MMGVRESKQNKASKSHPSSSLAAQQRAAPPHTPRFQQRSLQLDLLLSTEQQEAPSSPAPIFVQQLVGFGVDGLTAAVYSWLQPAQV